MKKIKLDRKERFLKYELLTKKEVEVQLENIVQKIKRLHRNSGNEKFPYLTSENLKYSFTPNIHWTPGFYTGLIMICYDYTKDEKFSEIARNQLETYRERIDNGGEPIDTHDLGFLYSLSAVAYFKRFHDSFSKKLALDAAEILKGRYIENCEMIQAWTNKKNALHPNGGEGQMIIDTNLNLPLLYWASEVSNNSSFSQVATSHLNTAIKYLVRPDYTQNHTYLFDVKSGNPLRAKTHQGKCDDSIWARGQAWCVLGFPISYKYINRDDLLDLTINTLHRFLNLLPDDLIAPWDFAYDDLNGVQKDASSNAIVVCGILEFIKNNHYLSETEILMYRKIAHNLLKALINQNYISTNKDEDGILLHSVRNFSANLGVDEFTLWGDYYFAEALIRIYQDWEEYW